MQKDVSDAIGKTEGYVSLLLSGKGKNPKNLNPDDIEKIQQASRNRAITQWLDLRSRGMLQAQSLQTEEDRLRQRLAEIQAQRAA